MQNLLNRTKAAEPTGLSRHSLAGDRTRTDTMKTIAGVIVLSLFCCVRFAYGTVYNSNGSSSDVQAKINIATNGDTVTLPSGSFTWSAGITVSGKAITIQGAGSGRVIGRSASSVAVGTGSKTFTTQSGLFITNGQTLKIERTGTVVSSGQPTGTRAYMIGTVTSYSGTTLVMNITSTSGSGTHSVWIISTSAATTLTHSASASTLASLTEATGGNVDFSGIFFVNGSGTGDFIHLNRVSGGKPIRVHDCYFESSSSTGDCIQADTNRGVIWNCSFSALPFAQAQLALHHIDCPTDSWTTAANWGASDTDGTHALYFEDCDFHAWLNATDMDNSSRTVIRHCLFNNAGLGTHGADTSLYGQRYFEFYDSEFVFNGFSNGQTLPLNWWFFIRGGTFIVTDCIIPAMNSQDYPNKNTYRFMVMNLQRSAGPNPCWGANIAGLQYPAPRQAGMGRVTGTAGNDSVTYRGDSEPIYLWNNTGTGAHNVGFDDFGGCTNPDSTVGYVVAGRDYFDNGTAKPGYQKYTYPHPLHGGGPPSAPQNLHLASPTPTP